MSPRGCDEPCPYCRQFITQTLLKHHVERCKEEYNVLMEKYLEQGAEMVRDAKKALDKMTRLSEEDMKLRLRDYGEEVYQLLLNLPNETPDMPRDEDDDL